ncbi:alpha/beta fold hydrolase [Cupriavidus basilensis]|uniref:Alpha/beta fold hydrolase n=1 Tax=Cupriavidus basilensis TaxID=68895 RepID=A0ABT6AMN0_9BURK|nr:alpha/beta fold hydrolase [Cupriavidus basilensis]MDF3833562.1 alpha/beta fold hydrolase [Cupriavidus basilensis]
MAALQLFCLPHAGASATTYLRWRRLLPADIALVPLEPPGRGARLDEPLLRDFEALASAMTDALCRHRAHAGMPYALFGHSMGGLLAWRVCHLLRERGYGLPRGLVVSGCAAPTRRDSRRLAPLRGDAALAEDLRKHGGTPEAVFADPELLRMTLDVLDADYRVCESFQRADVPPLPMSLHVFAGHDDPILPADLHAWAIESQVGHTLDWFAGGHFFLHDDPAAVVRRLVTHLEAPQASTMPAFA